ncbi:uncharacterized protein [Clytia hemisphaerica]|uniref:NACHT domain-containing protein n=1 Tax=Clytia hemisphaerica TaxID=252671 RepID=A0A7M5WQV1_9CNID
MALPTVNAQQSVKDEYENWLRLATLLHSCLKIALWEVLHNDKNDPNYIGLPVDPKSLKTEFKNQIEKIKDLQKKKPTRPKILNKEQVDCLLPPNSQETDSKCFDVTLLCVLIIQFTDLPPPVETGSWWSEVKPNDISVAAWVIRARNWRNKVLHHSNPDLIDANQFNTFWTECEHILHGLGYVNNAKIQNLKTVSLDKNNHLVAKALTSLADLKREIAKNAKDITENKVNITENTVKIAENTEKITKNTEKLTENTEKLTENTEKLTENTENITENTVKLTEYAEKLTENTEKLTEYAEKLTENTEKLTEYSENITENAENIAEFKENIAEFRLKQDHQEKKINDISAELQFSRLNLAQGINHLQANKEQTVGYPISIEKGKCLSEVIEYILKTIAGDYSRFLSSLRQASSTELHHLDLKELLQKVQWKTIQQKLERLGKHGRNMVQYITENTLTTEDIKYASEKLKDESEKNIERLIKLLNKPFDCNDEEEDDTTKENLFTDLTVLKAGEKDKDVNNSDREILLQQRHLQKQSIEIDELFQKDDKIVFVRGVGGMGKTTLIEMYASRLITKKLNNNLPIDFVFYLSCRKVNMLLRKGESKSGDFESLSVTKVLESEYPEIFPRIITVEDLKPIACRVLIIVDGLDELQDVYKSNTNIQRNTPFQVITDLINTKGDFLDGHNSIACGRPKACDFIKSHISNHANSIRENIKIKTVEVCGFKDENVIKYIDRFFGKNKEKADRVKKAINSSENLKFMSNVPVFLMVICKVYSKDLIKINTLTELYMFACSVFLKDHLKTQNEKDENHQDLISIVDNKFIMDCIFSIMVLSVNTYMKNQVLFDVQDIAKLGCPVDLETTGFIDKINRGPMKTPIFQFKHLVLQEFFCGFYLHVTKEISRFKNNTEFPSCAPIIFGINRLLRDNENELFIKFYEGIAQAMIRRNKPSLIDKAKRKFHRLRFQWYISKHSLDIPDCMKEANHIVIDTDIPECQEFLTNLYESKLKIECPSAEVKVVNLPRGIDLRNTLFMIEHLHLKLNFPDCMIGDEYLIVDTGLDECVRFIEFVYESKIRLNESLPVLINNLKMPMIDALSRKLFIVKMSFVLTHLRLALKIPSCMDGTDGFVLNTNLPACQFFLEIFFESHQGQKISNYSHSFVRIASLVTGTDFRYACSMIERLHLTVKIPSCMIGRDSIIITPGITECKWLITFLNSFKAPVHFPFDRVELTSASATVDLGNTATIIKYYELKLKLPKCMQGEHALIINTDSEKCMEFIKLYSALNEKLAIDPSFHAAEIVGSIRLMRETHSIMSWLNLKLRIPSCMVGPKSLIINTEKTDCTTFLALIYQSNPIVENLFSYQVGQVELQGKLNGTDNIRNAQFFINAYSLKLQIPSCMIGDGSIIIDVALPECRRFMTMLYEAKFEIKWPYQRVVIRGELFNFDKRNVIYFTNAYPKLQIIYE